MAQRTTRWNPAWRVRRTMPGPRLTCTSVNHTRETSIPGRGAQGIERGNLPIESEAELQLEDWEF